MSSNQNNFAEGMLKGRMAETLVEELLRKSGNTVYRFGYEAILQNISQLKSAFDRYSEIGLRIRAIPDFIAIDKDGKPIFLEVKYRWDGKLHDDDKIRLKNIGDFWSAKIIFVNCANKPFFNISEAPYVDANGRLISKPLKDETSWKIDPKVYDEFELLVQKYLSPTLFKNSINGN